MGLFQKDYLLRLLEELSEMAAAIRVSLGSGRARQALDAIAEARKKLAGPLAGSLARLDASSVVALLGREKARAFVELARLEAEAHAALGDDEASHKATQRAAEIERGLTE